MVFMAAGDMVQRPEVCMQTVDAYLPSLVTEARPASCLFVSQNFLWKVLRSAQTPLCTQHCRDTLSFLVGLFGGEPVKLFCLFLFEYFIKECEIMLLLAPFH